MLTRSPSELGDCSEVIFAKMDLSADSQSLQNRLQFLKSRSGYVSPSPPPLTSDPNIDTIDIAKINFGDDESWLCTLQKGHEEQIADLKEWLHKNEELNDNFLLSTEQTSSQIESQKSFDSRTFTRPKKRFTRPSIERFNEEMYGSGNEDNVSTVIKRKLSIRPLSESFVIQEKNETTNGVEFDLSLPSSSYYFEKMSAETGEADSFQNMSPPSLVNSMCSSTFANLMESSFIKNDPVLREIRDTDFTESVLLQDSEPPMFQSITESCSSINSDTAENFLKKVSFNGTFKKNSSRDSDRNISVKNRQSSISDNAKTYENSKELSEGK
ncbi:hypothetical protein JTB14_002917 [Gonioctena quinquepunctata]|nr:hypothetical protein JTB14_002917 [Gonioctena quinquepunctata]